MHISSDAFKIILIVIIVYVVVKILMIIIYSEMDRTRQRNIIPTKDMYYGSKMWITAGMNMFIHMHVKDRSDIEPFPNMESNFPDHDKLDDNWKQIRNEVMDLYSKEGMSKIKGDLFFDKIADENWKKFYIKWYGPCLKDSEQKLPFTTNLIKNIPQIQCAMISVLEPGAIITPHVGPFRGSLRYHLGLSTPNDDNCFILVDGIKYSWRDGESVLFDDTFVHEVRNDTDKPRFILFLDVKRDLCNWYSNKVNDVACKIAGITSRKNKNPNDSKPNKHQSNKSHSVVNSLSLGIKL